MRNNKLILFSVEIDTASRFKNLYAQLNINGIRQISYVRFYQNQYYITLAGDYLKDRPAIKILINHNNDKIIVHNNFYHAEINC
jgi:hypothetical protein